MSTTAVAAIDASLLPRRLSPSRAGDYATCPKMFFHKSIEKLSSPPSVASTAGNLAHLVFERVFDLPREGRTLEAALALLEPSWVELCNPVEGTAPHLVAAAAGYSALAPAGSVELSEIFVIARESVEGWFKMETPSRFDPEGREVELEAEFDGLRFGGILDRLDCYTGRLDGSEPRKIWVISDYKSGSVPKPQYEAKAFQAMSLYAALVKEQLGIDVDLLRLVYVRTGDRDGGILTKRVTPSVLANEVARMTAIRKGIERSAETNTWDHKVGPLCSFCPFTAMCPEGAAEVERRAIQKAERAAREAADAALADAQAPA